MVLDGVEGAATLAVGELVGDSWQALVHLAVGLEGASREDDPLGVLLEGSGRTRLGALGHVDVGGGVADAGGGAHDDGGVVALGDLEGLLHHGVALLEVLGVEDRDLCEGGKATRVLLGLGRDGAGVVRHKEDEAALDAHVVQAHERVGGHVETHLLAGKEASRACVGGACQHLEGGLLVGGPLDVDAVGHALLLEFGHRLDELRRGRARVAGHHANARLKRGVGKGLVTHNQLLCHIPLLDIAGALRGRPAATRYEINGQQRTPACQKGVVPKQTFVKPCI